MKILIPYQDHLQQFNDCLDALERMKDTLHKGSYKNYKWELFFAFFFMRNIPAYNKLVYESNERESNQTPLGRRKFIIFKDFDLFLHKSYKKYKKGIDKFNVKDPKYFNVQSQSEKIMI